MGNHISTRQINAVFQTKADNGKAPDIIDWNRKISGLRRVFDMVTHDVYLSRNCHWRETALGNNITAVLGIHISARQNSAVYFINMRNR
jgi:hypothetical protein